MRRLALSSLLLLPLLTGAPAFGATGIQSPNPIVINGTEGRDEVVIRTRHVNGSFVIVIVGAASVTGGALGNGTPGCDPDVNPVTNRVVSTTCFPSSASYLVNLGAGDDFLNMDTFVDPSDIDSPPEPLSVTVSGGAGADVLSVASITRDGGSRTVKGLEGDDVLSAPFPRLDSGGVVLDGGAGRDQADYVVAPEGVNASLAAGTATMTNTSGPVTRTRTDTLAGIERLSGSNDPDVLAGSRFDDELLGQGGDDVLQGDLGNDVLDGGPGADLLDSGDGIDTVIGGPGRDVFPESKGKDTYQTRDAFQEEITCAKDDTVVADLVDKVANPAGCLNISVAAAKHTHDTLLTRGPLRVLNGRVAARIACPAAKPERCAGTLTLRRGGDRGPLFGRVRYSLARGRSRIVPFAVTGGGGAATLTANEVDADKRPRRVLSRIRLV